MSTFTQRIEGNILKNGEHQRILWMGVNGFIIINDSTKEIIIIDPWPTYEKKFLGFNSTSKGNKRLFKLAKWLTEATQKGYTLEGIIVGHEHYDHCKDVKSLIYVMLNRFNLPKDGVPTIYCDTGTKNVIQKISLTYYNEYEDDLEHYAIPSGVLKFYEYQLEDGTSIYYDDTKQYKKYNDNETHYPLPAGEQASPFSAGGFYIIPYVWDHAVIGRMKKRKRPGCMSGTFQRQGAFLIKPDTPDKRTIFLNGSAGEMNKEFTHGTIKDVSIAADILLQSIPIDCFFNRGFKLEKKKKEMYDKQLSAMVDYQTSNITAHDKIIPTHWEDFVIPKADTKKRFLSNSDRVTRYVKELKTKQPTLNEKNVCIMPRFLIEYDDAEIVAS